VVKKRPVAPPAEAQPITTGDLRTARLEVQNAQLRQQLAQAQQPVGPIVDPDAALAELAAGNRRFVEGTRVRTQLSMQDPDLRAALAKGQAPFAVIVTCSDSRLVDNLIFDQELGRLFTIREAGNAPDIQGLASVEYALEHLGSQLVVILGHSHCGAVKAVAEAHGRPMPGNLWSLQAAMAGLLESTYQELNEDEDHYQGRLAQVNARRQAQAVLDRSEIVRERVAKGKAKVVPAIYDLASGKVTFEPAVAAVSGAHH
jgi:carbonic anhydrase